jgi:hypothetical protein
VSYPLAFAFLGLLEFCDLSHQLLELSVKYHDLIQCVVSLCLQGVDAPDKFVLGDHVVILNCGSWITTLMYARSFLPSAYVASASTMPFPECAALTKNVATLLLTLGVVRVSLRLPLLSTVTPLTDVPRAVAALLKSIA